MISNDVVTGAVGAATCAAPAINSATLVNDNFVQYEGIVPTDGVVDSLTVTAVAGSPADGAAANAWQVAFIQNGLPGTESVVIDVEGDDDPAYGGVPTFIMTANFGVDGGLTEEGFVQIWSDSPAAALVTAETTEDDGVVAPLGVAAPGAVVPLFAIVDTFGAQDSTVTVVFDRPVIDADATGLWSNLNDASQVLGAATTVSDIPTTGTDTVTFVWEDLQDPTAIPALPNYQIRFDPGTVQDAASEFFNIITAKAQPSPLPDQGNEVNAE